MTAQIKPDKGRTITSDRDKTELEYKAGESYAVAKVEGSVVWLIHPKNPAVTQPFIIVEDVILKDEG